MLVKFNMIQVQCHIELNYTKNESVPSLISNNGDNVISIYLIYGQITYLFV